MSTNNFVSRRIEAHECRIVGQQVQINSEALRQKGESFPSKLERALQEMGAVTLELSARVTDEVSMGNLDRDTDSVVAGFSDGLEQTARVLRPLSYLDASADAQARYLAANELSRRCFPAGTSFLRAPYREQWLSLERIQGVLQAPETQGFIGTLGLALEVKRVLSLIDLYGKRLGMTEARSDDLIAVLRLVDAWHTRYERVLVQAHAFYDDANDTEQQAKLGSFYGPYLALVERIRQEQAPRATSRP